MNMDTWIVINRQWIHVAITFDGEQKKTYVDGELQPTTDVNDMPPRFVPLEAMHGKQLHPTNKKEK